MPSVFLYPMSAGDRGREKLSRIQPSIGVIGALCFERGDVFACGCLRLVESLLHLRLCVGEGAFGVGEKPVQLDRKSVV